MTQPARPSAHDIYDRVRQDAHDELERPSSSLAFSGLFAGFTIGATPLAYALALNELGSVGAAPLIASLAYPIGFAESDAGLVYVLLYSRDGGRTWRNMRDGSIAVPGETPWIDGVGPDPARTQMDQNPGEDETWTWPTPEASFPQGSYLIRIEGHRSAEALHYVQHTEKIYVER